MARRMKAVLLLALLAFAPTVLAGPPHLQGTITGDGVVLDHCDYDVTLGVPSPPERPVDSYCQAARGPGVL